MSSSEYYSHHFINTEVQYLQPFYNILLEIENPSFTLHTQTLRKLVSPRTIMHHALFSQNSTSPFWSHFSKIHHLPSFNFCLLLLYLINLICVHYSCLE